VIEHIFEDCDKKVRRLHRLKVVATITLISISASLLITYAILMLTGSEKLPIIFIIATLAPAIIAPITSWSIVGLMVKVQKLEEAHRRQAAYDELTSLLSRRALLNQGEALLTLCARNKQAFALALLDLDNFKAINDQYGHGGGDEVLRAFARIMRQEMRSSDLAGRLGGEEFVVVLPGARLADAQQVLERIRVQTQNSEIVYLQEIIKLTVSIGLAVMPAHSDKSFATLVQEADNALYQAKEKGRNLVVPNTSTDRHEDISGVFI